MHCTSSWVRACVRLWLRSTAKQLSPQTFAQNKQQLGGQITGAAIGAGTNCRTCSWFAQHMFVCQRNRVHCRSFVLGPWATVSQCLRVCQRLPASSSRRAKNEFKVRCWTALILFLGRVQHETKSCQWLQQQQGQKSDPKGSFNTKSSCMRFSNQQSNELYKEST